jgi:hypothetical protein
MAVIEKHERHFLLPELGSTIIVMLNRIMGDENCAVR